MICMIELGELERHHEEFAARNVRVFAISNDGLNDAEANQRDFPHLIVVSDTDQGMAKALATIHPGVGPGGTDTNAPTVFIVDGTGKVRWMSRPERIAARHTPQELLEAIDQSLGSTDRPTS